MADGIELASAYVTIIPSLKGAQKRIEAELGGVDTSGVGGKLGSSLGGSIASGLSKSGLKKIEAEVASAERNLSQARQRAEDSAKSLEIAERRLAEAREKYGDGSSQVAQAELALTQERRRAATASQQYFDANTKLADANDRLTKATEHYNSAAGKQERALAELSAKATAAASSIKDASSRINDAGEKIMGIGGKMTAGITVPVAGAAAALGGFALKTASAAETTEISFTTMLGSSEAALGMMDELADFAAHTPFELSGLQTATRQLLAYGFTAEDVIPMLTAVGDATAALGTGQAGIESVTRALGQMRTRGKASAEEMLQLTEAGVPAWEYLARAIGTDTAGAMEAVTDGAVDADTAIKALTDGMEQDFGGMMEEQSKTVEGLFSNLSDAIEQPLMKLRETDAYDRFADALSNVVDSAGPFVESLLPHMENGLDGAAGLLDKATDAMDSFAEMSEEGQANILGVVAAAAGAGPALTVLGGALRVVGTVGSGIGSIVGKAGDAIGSLSKQSSTAAGGVGKLTGGLSLLKGGLVVLGLGAFAVTVGIVADQFAKAAEHERLLSDATTDFDAMAQRASGTLQNMRADVDGVLGSMADLSAQATDAMTQIGADNAKLDGYVDSIERLAGQSELSASEQYELKNAVEQYNSITGDTVEVVDAANGKLSESTEAISANAEAWKDNAEAQALQSVATQYYEEQIRAAQELSTAQDELAAAQERLAAADEALRASPSDPMAIQEWQAASAAVEDAEGKVSDLSSALEAAEENADAFGNAAATAGADIESGLKSAVQGLPAEMQSFGRDVATQLSAGIASGSVSAEDAASYISGTVSSTIGALPPSMQANGAAAAASLATGISSGQITVQQASDILTAVVKGEASTLPPELQPMAAAAANAFASGIGEGEAPTFDNAAKIAAAASTMDDVGDMYSSGYHLVQNFSRGINAGKSLAEAAANAVAGVVASPLRFSVPDEGPWSGSERGGYTSGRHLVENFAAGMLSGVPAVRAAALDVSYGAAPRSVSAGAARPIAAGMGRSVSQTFVFNQPVRSPVEIAREMRMSARYGIAATV